MTPKGFEPLFWERAIGTYQSPNQVTPRGFEPLFTPSGAMKNKGSEQTKTQVISQFGIWRHGISAPAAPVRQVAGAASRRVLIDLASGRVQRVSTELAWGLPARPGLPRFAAFCRAGNPRYSSNCNRDRRVRASPLTLS